jgi:hypothetical protein
MDRWQIKPLYKTTKWLLDKPELVRPRETPLDVRLGQLNDQYDYATFNQ